MSNKNIFYVLPVFNNFTNYKDKPIYVNIKSNCMHSKEYFIEYNDENKIIKIDEKYLKFHDIYETQYDENGNSIYEFAKYTSGEEIKIYKTYNKNNDIISFTKISNYEDPFTRIFKYNEEGELILVADTIPYSTIIAYNHNKTECFEIPIVTNIRIERSKDKKEKLYYEINSEKLYCKECYNDNGKIISYYDFTGDIKKEYFYNNNNNISKNIIKRISDESVVLTAEYFYDKNGNISSSSEGDEYKYDDKNRLIYRSISSPTHLNIEAFYKYGDE
mgnify:CR=1 FL=1